MRLIRYQVIADDLRRRIGAAEFDASRLLPSEAELSRGYDASRVTVRRALEVLRTEGLVDSRQGYGWLVPSEPLSQDLSRLDTIERQLEGAGIVSDRRILHFGHGRAPEVVEAILGCQEVLTVRRLNLADGEPFALVTVWCPRELSAPFSKSTLEDSSFLEQLPVQIQGATQTISAELANPETSELLKVPVGSPVLVVERVTRSIHGDPVLVSEHIFPAHRTRFRVELSVDDRSFLRAGVQLVEG